MSNLKWSSRCKDTMKVLVGAFAGAAGMYYILEPKDYAPQTSAESAHAAEAAAYSQRRVQKITFLDEQIASFAESVRGRMPTRNVDQDALNWHNVFNSKCAPYGQTDAFIFKGDKLEFPSDEHEVVKALACLHFVEETAINRHLPYNSGTVEIYDNTLHYYLRQGYDTPWMVPEYKQS